MPFVEGVRHHAYVHGLAEFVLLLVVVWSSMWWKLFERLRMMSPWMELDVQLYRHWPWLFPCGFALDAAVLYLLGCSPSGFALQGEILNRFGWTPRRDRWLAVAWFSLVLIAILVLVALTCHSILDVASRITPSV